MSDANPQQEPSMEEILASIRRIISEDDEPGANSEETPVEAASEDVLELTEVAEELEPAPIEEEVEEEPAEEIVEEEISIDEVLEEVPQEEELELRETEIEIVEPPPAAAPAPVPSPPTESGLLAAETAAAAAGTLSGLVAAVDRAHGGSVLGDGNRTIEDLVKEIIRPMVKDWLDENLPALTERLVRREIERLARHVEDD